MAKQRKMSDTCTLCVQDFVVTDYLKLLHKMASFKPSFIQQLKLIMDREMGRKFLTNF